MTDMTSGMTSSMTGGTKGLVTVFGGSGFLGRHVVQALARRNWRIKVAVRRPDLAFDLQPLGMVGQITSVQANVRFARSIHDAARGSDAVVNLVGILTPTGQQNFETVHATAAQVIGEAAAQANARSFVQLSAIGADAASASEYARSKAHGEAAALQAFPDCVVLRPSIVFGPEDEFFNRFAALARIAPVMPLIGGGGTRFQPVYVGDVADAVARVVDGDVHTGENNGGPATHGKPFELGGPEVKTFKELLAYICTVTGRRRPFVSIPFGVAHYVPALATEVMDRATLGRFPKLLLTTRDQVKLLQNDNVVSDEAIAGKRTLADLGVTPTAIDAIVPSYLYRFRKTGQFDRGMP